MLKEFDKLIADIRKLPKFWIIKEFPKVAIIGTHYSIVGDYINTSNLFSEVPEKIGGTIPTFFMVSCKKDDLAEGDALFNGSIIPAWVIEKKSEIFPLQNLQKSLEDFVQAHIVHWNK